jgi:hypothetical protein
MVNCGQLVCGTAASGEGRRRRVGFAAPPMPSWMSIRNSLPPACLGEYSNCQAAVSGGGREGFIRIRVERRIKNL